MQGVYFGLKYNFLIPFDSQIYKFLLKNPIDHTY